MKFQVECIGVVGDDASEFSDLLGMEGKLRFSEDKKKANFHDVTIYIKRKTKKDDKIILKSQYDNTFTFKIKDDNND